MNAGNQRVEQVVLGGRPGIGTARGRERLGRHHRPADRQPRADGIDETEGVHAVEGAVFESGRYRPTADQLHRRCGFRVSGHKRRALGGIGLAGRSVRPCGQELLVECLRRPHGEYGEVDHRRAPLLSIPELEENPHTPDRVGRIGGVWLPSGQRKASDDRRATRLEDRRLGEGNALAIAVEVAADADALGVIAANARVKAAHELERVCDSRRRERARPQPARGVREQTGNSYDHRSNRHEPQDQIRP